MNLGRFAAAIFLLASLSMQSGAVPGHRHAVVHAKGSASLHRVAAHGKGATSRLRDRSSAGARRRGVRGVPAGHAVIEHATAESRRLSSAFIASAMLRPMAQQLLSTRSAAAYNGVLAYAAAHPGEAAAAANLSIGHAYALDHRFGDAEGAFRAAAGAGDALADYADYLGAQAAISAGRPGDAIATLEHFADKHPDSLFVPQAPVLLASAYLAGNDPNNAVRVLQPLEGSGEGNHLDVRAMLARAYQASGNTASAAALYRGIYLGDPTSSDAANAKTQLAAMNVPLTAGERKQHADALFNAKQYTQAAAEYRALEQNDSSLTQADKDALEIYEAVCDLRLKHITRGDVDHLPVTNDDTAALKTYLQAELARSAGNTAEQDALVRVRIRRT